MGRSDPLTGRHPNDQNRRYLAVGARGQGRDSTRPRRSRPRRFRRAGLWSAVARGKRPLCGTSRPATGSRRSSDIWTASLRSPSLMMEPGSRPFPVRSYGSGKSAIYMMATRKPCHGHGCAQGRITTLAFSPDDAHLLTAGTDGTARLWETDYDGDEAVILHSDDQTSSARFSPDGRAILTASLDKSARLWNAEPPALVSIPGDGRGVSLAVFSDGRRSVTIRLDSTNSTKIRVELWRLPEATGIFKADDA